MIFFRKFTTSTREVLMTTVPEKDLQEGPCCFMQRSTLTQKALWRTGHLQLNATIWFNSLRGRMLLSSTSITPNLPTSGKHLAAD